jgi:HD superfamily phosphodiesterase
MQIKKIYSRFQLPKNLQEHMLRVGGVASIIAYAWNGPLINKKSIVSACLLHDIGKPVGFDLKSQAKFGIPKLNPVKLKKMQTFIKKNFSADEHIASLKIAKSLGVDKTVLHILENLSWYNIEKLLKQKDFDILIALYADMRVGPKGVLTLEKRIKDLEKRKEKNLSKFIKMGKKLEEKINKNTNINLSLITNNKVHRLFKKLLLKSVLVY